MKTATYGALLPFRFVGFVVFQLAIMAVFLAAGAASSWEKSQGLWIITGFLTNIVTWFVLARLLKADGRRYRDLIRIDRQALKQDWLLLLGSVLIIVVLASLPLILFAFALYGSMTVPSALLFRRIPIAVLGVGVAWALTQGMLELPFYFSALMPHIGKDKGNWLGYALAAFFLAFQHVGLPLILEWKFMVWRFGMFVFFAYFAGLILKKKPAFFPPLMVLHALLDISTLSMFLVSM